MAIGTSDGEYHESEFDMLVATAEKYVNKDTKFQTHQQRIDDTFQATQEAIRLGIMDPQGGNNLK